MKFVIFTKYLNQAAPVKRSGIFITVLLSLFMFQSLWNVAAAFCDHESTVSTTAKLIPSHFGHHVAPNCTQDQQQHSISSIFNDELSKSIIHDHINDAKAHDFLNHLEDDHSDHLPSFAHFIVADVSQQAEQPKFIAYPESAFIDWKNLYQSPDLFLPNPPPASAPL